ncbi:MAG TPA: ATP-binding protein [Gaiellaceae bacterium]|nr:ATP-binding protein [Gaiellaceae bacterium]
MEDARAYEELRVGFTAAVSHELRTPLARLLALLESATLPDADTEDLLDQARGEVEQMRALVDDILFLSELESGREVVSLGSTPALPVFEQVRDRLAERAERADVAIVLDVQPGAQLPVRRRMLQVVVENLADNAIRYAGPRATLTLRARPGLLEAQDDGPGVDEAEASRLFERFYRSDRARASRGTGLGLAIVKHVVTAAGGQVEVSTGPGLRVTCSFPSS